jgi:hypothetical protein
VTHDTFGLMKIVLAGGSWTAGADAQRDGDELNARV